MDVQPIAERLRERLADLRLREVAEASSLDEAMRGNKASPAVYVLPLSERGSQLLHTGTVDQLELRVFGVLMVLDVSRRAGQVDLATLRRRVKQALIGWVPEEATGEPVTFQGGELVDLPGNGTQWWADDYLMTGYFRSEE